MSQPKTNQISMPDDVSIRQQIDIKFWSPYAATKIELKINVI